MAVLSVILAMGALVYMRSSKTSYRVWALVIGLVLSWVMATAFLATYWHGRQEFWMLRPGHRYETTRWMVKGWVGLAALMFAPVLLGLLRRSVNSIRAA